MNEITVSILKDNPAALCICKGDTADVFTFSDERACAEAAELCEELSKHQYEAIDGQLGNPVVALVTAFDRDAVIFDFGEKRDAATACAMVYRYYEIADSDEDEDDSDEE